MQNIEYRYFKPILTDAKITAINLTLSKDSKVKTEKKKKPKNVFLIKKKNQKKK